MQSEGESLSTLTSRQKTTDTAVMLYHSTDSCSCWWNPHIIMFQSVGGREINITEEQKLILCHVSTRTNQVYMNAARMRQSQLPLPPSLPPSSAPLNQMLWLSFGAFVCCVKNNGGRSRWNIASAANPYGSEKAACQVQTPLLQAHLEQNHHINCQLMCLHTARINPWEKLVDPGRAVSGRGCVFPARKAAGGEVSSQMCGQRRIRKLNNAAEGHLSRSLSWYSDSTSCQYIQRWLQKQLSGSKSSCRDLRGCDHTRRFPEHTCIFYCLFWMFGRSTQGLNDSGPPELDRSPGTCRGWQIYMCRSCCCCCGGVFRRTRLCELR